MRYRNQTPTGDYAFPGTPYFLVDSPEAVGQAIKTRLTLNTKEWFIDLREGLDLGKILGFHTQNTRDLEVKRRISGTKGVLQILNYSSYVTAERGFTVEAEVSTIYGTVTITQDFQP